MDRISYAAETFVTGTAIAQSLLEYARDLAQSETSDTIDVPVLGEDGKPRRTTLLIGPASQIVSVPTESDQAELEDAEFIADIQLRQRRLKTTVEPSPADPQTTRMSGEIEYDISD